MSEFNHISVLLNECIDNLNIKPNGIYVDGTAGGGGHSLHIAEKLSENGRLICIDRDEAAIIACKKRLDNYSDRVSIVRANFSQIDTVLKGLGISYVDGILLDLGVSSYQIDTEDRGFSFRCDSQLDMRMDNRSQLTAKRVVNEYPKEELERIFFTYGEEKFSKRIAAEIVKQREICEINTTYELVDLVRRCVPVNKKDRNQNPATRIFQAIRIEVNNELKEVESVIDTAMTLLGDKGRLCVISFHSLEDRIVKTKFNYYQKDCECPSDFPVCVCNKESMGKVITKKAITASQNELEINSRSRSAKLRVFERIIKE